MSKNQQQVRTAVVLWLLAFGGLVCWPTSAFAGAHLTGTVTGRLVEAPPGITIEIVAEARAQRRIEIPDAEGRFFTTHLIPGTYTIRTCASDAEVREAQFELSPGDIVDVKLDLAAGDGFLVRSRETRSIRVGESLSLDFFAGPDVEPIDVEWGPGGSKVMLQLAPPRLVD